MSKIALYETIELIGRGGMGAVYRARNRLTGQLVALKQVQTAVLSTNPINATTPSISSEGSEAMAIALTREFQTLAALRHPYIISVLDYGFDAEQRPFFVMELIENGLTLLEYGRNQPQTVQIRLIEQLLEALLYLHRHGILHRDLKPANVLVVGGQVKLLDFGLSVLLERESQIYHTDTQSGTFAYTPPEIISGQGFSRASDLYAVGIMFYELLTQCHPFNTANLGLLIQEILTKQIDLSYLPADNLHLWQLIERLLAKDARQRYQDAALVLDDLRTAFALPATSDATAIRESYLQSARFIGRKRELSQLLGSLIQAAQGEGQAWLVAGESGVGKSRLLNELRIRALIRGFVVVQGQGVTGGGLPYQLWRDVLPRLLLNVALTDWEIGVLREIVPQITRLAGRKGTAVAKLTGADGRRRLAQTILEVLRRHPQPILLLLEDLQWVKESLAILQEIIPHLASLPLLLVGNYRHEERPNLPQLLPGTAVLTLNPLDRAQIAELSTAVLGPSGDDSDLLDFLAWGSEGNAFFVIELLRTFTEQVDQISTIGQKSKQFMADGIGRIVRQRLESLSEEWQQFLKLAAVSGRQLDLTLLAQFYDPDTLNRSLYASLDAGLLEVFEEQWRFAHDKLREGILALLTPPEQAALHGEIAAGLEQAYPHDAQYATALARHWEIAGQPEKMVPYALTAAAQMIQRGSFEEAFSLLHRALPQTAVAPQQARLQYELGNACEGLGKREQAVAYLQNSLQIYRDAENWDGIMQVLNTLGQVYSKQGEFLAAITVLEEALALARQHDDKPGLAHALLWLGDALYMAYEDNQQATIYLQEALQMARATGDPVLIGRTLNIMGEHRRYFGQYGEAAVYYQEALPLYESIGHAWGIAIINTNTGHIMRLQNQSAPAWRHYRAALQIMRQQEMLSASWELLAGVAGLLLVAGQTQRATEILALVNRQPGLDIDAYNIAAPITAELTAQLPPDVWETAVTTGTWRTTAEIIDEIISQEHL